MPKKVYKLFVNDFAAFGIDKNAGLLYNKCIIKRSRIERNDGKMIEKNSAPLAQRMRPETIDDIVGQKHLVGPNGALRRMLQRGYVTNLIFYGPPGTGKTTAANIIAKEAGMTIHRLNATTASLADVKEVIASTDSVFGRDGVLLYLDEIQYFNKKQQQSLLEFMEDGRITLIASTTENPYIYVYNAIISRSAVMEFKSLTASDIEPLIEKAIKALNEETGENKTAEKEVIRYIAECGAGDARRSLNLIENAYYVSGDAITKEEIKYFSPKAVGSFDAAGVVHYDMLSALQKSIRGSDPDAAVFYLAKILEGGDLIGACRRLQVIAAEDVGLAYPQAIPIVRACVEIAFDVGMPEARLALADAAILLATAPKSNSGHNAIIAATEFLQTGKGQNVPAHMRPSNRFDGYKYPHDYPGHYVKQQYLPDDVVGTTFYEYGDNKTEQAAKQYWDKIKNS